MDPPIGPSAVGQGSPSGTRSRTVTGVAGGAETVRDELPNAGLRQRNAERESLAEEPRTADPELGGQRVDALKLTAGELDLDAAIERLKVRAVERHQILPLLRRPVGVPGQWDSSGVARRREDERERLIDSVLEVVGRDDEGVGVSVQNVAQGLRSGTLATNGDTRAEDPKLLHSSLEAQRTGIRSTGLESHRGAAKVPEASVVIGSELTSSSSQASFNSNPDDSGPARAELGDQGVHTSHNRVVEEDRQADTAGMFGHV